MKSPDRTKPIPRSTYHVAAAFPLRCVMLLSLLLGATTGRSDDFGISRRNSTFSQSSAYQRSMPQAPYQPNPAPVSSEAGPAPALAAPSASKVASQAAAPVTSDTASQEARAPLANVIRLAAFDSSGQSFGSGAYIGNYGDYGLILSNWHVVCEADGLVHIHFSNGFSSYGAILTADKKWDLALIAISHPPQSVPLLPVARSIPKPGDSLWIAGYGSGNYRLAGGRCIRYLAPEIPSDGSAPLYEIIELSVSARKGDSGGPILNAHGELAGVLFGSDMVQNTAGSGCERVNRFLSQAHPALTKLPSRPEDFFYSIERTGPRRQLAESRTVTVPEPRAELPQRRMADFAGSSSQFGIRSGSRRYTQPPVPSQATVNAPFQDFRPSPPPSAVPGIEAPVPSPAVRQTPLSHDRKPGADSRIQTAVWKNSPESTLENLSETAPSIGDPAIRQAGHQAPLNPLAARAVPASADSAKSSDTGYRQETVSERSEAVSKMLSLGGVLLALALVLTSVALLKNDRRDSLER